MPPCSCRLLALRPRALPLTKNRNRAGYIEAIFNRAPAAASGPGRKKRAADEAEEEGGKAGKRRKKGQRPLASFSKYLKMRFDELYRIEGSADKVMQAAARA